MPIESYDLIVIGAGPAGEKGAITAASFRKKVCIVEKGHDVGGAVAWPDAGGVGSAADAGHRGRLV